MKIRRARVHKHATLNMTLWVWFSLEEMKFLIFSFLRFSNEARRWFPPLNTPCFRNSAENGEQKCLNENGLSYQLVPKFPLPSLLLLYNMRLTLNAIEGFPQMTTIEIYYYIPHFPTVISCPVRIWTEVSLWEPDDLNTIFANQHAMSCKFKTYKVLWSLIHNFLFFYMIWWILRSKGSYGFAVII